MKTLFAVVCIAASVGINVAGQSKPSIQGAWRLVEESTTGPNASTNTSVQGLFILTGRYYSVISVIPDAPRPDVPNVAKATADELRAAWSPLGAASGTYDLIGDLLTQRRLVGKASAQGTFLTLSYKVDGNTLTVTTKSNQDGPVTNPVTRKFTRLE